MNGKDSNSTKNSVERALIKALENSAKNQTAQSQAAVEQNQATNDRIDRLDGHMIALADKMGILVEAGIRREEKDNRNTETLNRLEKNQIELGKGFKNYQIDNDNRVAELEKLFLLLKTDYEYEKDAKEKKEKNIDHRKNIVIAALSIAFILAAFQLIAPYL